MSIKYLSSGEVKIVCKDDGKEKDDKHNKLEFYFNNEEYQLYYTLFKSFVYESSENVLINIPFFPQYQAGLILNKEELYSNSSPLSFSPSNIPSSSSYNNDFESVDKNKKKKKNKSSKKDIDLTPTYSSISTSSSSISTSSSISPTLCLPINLPFKNNNTLDIFLLLLGTGISLEVILRILDYIYTELTPLLFEKKNSNENSGSSSDTSPVTTPTSAYTSSYSSFISSSSSSSSSLLLKNYSFNIIQWLIFLKFMTVYQNFELLPSQDTINFMKINKKIKFLLINFRYNFLFRTLPYNSLLSAINSSASITNFYDISKFKQSFYYQSFQSKIKKFKINKENYQKNVIKFNIKTKFKILYYINFSCKHCQNIYKKNLNKNIKKFNSEISQKDCDSDDSDKLYEEVDEDYLLDGLDTELSPNLARSSSESSMNLSYYPLTKKKNTFFSLHDHLLYHKQIIFNSTSSSSYSSTFDPTSPISSSSLPHSSTSSSMSDLENKPILILEENVSVYRRFNEFEALSELLHQNYPGILIPPLPEKNFSFNFGSSEKCSKEYYGDVFSDFDKDSSESDESSDDLEKTKHEQKDFSIKNDHEIDENEEAIYSDKTLQEKLDPNYYNELKNRIVILQYFLNFLSNHLVLSNSIEIKYFLTLSSSNFQHFLSLFNINNNSTSLLSFNLKNSLKNFISSTSSSLALSSYDFFDFSSFFLSYDNIDHNVNYEEISLDNSLNSDQLLLLKLLKKKIQNNNSDEKIFETNESLYNNQKELPGDINNNEEEFFKEPEMLTESESDENHEEIDTEDLEKIDDDNSIEFNQPTSSSTSSPIIEETENEKETTQSSSPSTSNFWNFMSHMNTNLVKLKQSINHYYNNVAFYLNEKNLLNNKKKNFLLNKDNSNFYIIIKLKKMFFLLLQIFKFNDQYFNNFLHQNQTLYQLYTKFSSILVSSNININYKKFNKKIKKFLTFLIKKINNFYFILNKKLNFFNLYKKNFNNNLLIRNYYIKKIKKLKNSKFSAYKTYYQNFVQLRYIIQKNKKLVCQEKENFIEVMEDNLEESSANLTNSSPSSERKEIFENNKHSHSDKNKSDSNNENEDEYIDLDNYSTIYDKKIQENQEKIRMEMLFKKHEKILLNDEENLIKNDEVFDLYKNATIEDPTSLSPLNSPIQSVPSSNSISQLNSSTSNLSLKNDFDELLQIPINNNKTVEVINQVLSNDPNQDNLEDSDEFLMIYKNKKEKFLIKYEESKKNYKEIKKKLKTENKNFNYYTNIILKEYQDFYYLLQNFLQVS